MTPDGPSHIDVIKMKEKRPATLEERVERLEAKQTITEIVMAYSQLHDVPDWEAFMDYCTDDIERVVSGSVTARERGKKELLATYQRGQVLTRADGSRIVYDSSLKRKHLVVTPVVRISDNGQEGWYASYVSLVSTKEVDGEHLRSAHEATIVLNFVRQGDDWKIRKMLLNTEIGHDPLRK